MSFGDSRDGILPEVEAGLDRDVYCPVMPCRALQLLRGRRDELISSLMSQLHVLDALHPQSTGVVECNRRLVATLLLLERFPGVAFSWTRLESSVCEAPAVSFQYSRLVLGAYVYNMCLLVSSESPGRGCLSHHFEWCKSILDDAFSHLSMSVGEVDISQLPTIELLTLEQKASWSLAVSCVTLGLVGRVLNRNDLCEWSCSFLETWESDVIDVLNGSGLGGFHGSVDEYLSSVPPPYSEVDPRLL